MRASPMSLVLSGRPHGLLCVCNQPVIAGAVTECTRASNTRYGGVAHPVVSGRASESIRSDIDLLQNFPATRGRRDCDVAPNGARVGA